MLDVNLKYLIIFISKTELNEPSLLSDGSFIILSINRKFLHKDKQYN